MWIVTEHGFFTFVQDRKDPDYLWLRARVREDLERNFPAVTVEEHPGADYLFRARVRRTEVAERISELVMAANITSHFKDEVAKRAPKTEFGSRSSAMYAFWNGMAACQPYAPYSRTPRTKITQTWKGGSADRKPGSGQQSIGFGEPYRYGGTGGSYRGSEFDWDSRSWNGGNAAKDPVVTTSSVSDTEMDEWWASLTDAERDEILDEEIAAERGALRGPDVAVVAPAPRNRPGNRRSKKGKRRNRHNQLGFSDSQAREEARNRQTYLDRKHGKKGA